jgi:hypothetical protein
VKIVAFEEPKLYGKWKLINTNRIKFLSAENGTLWNIKTAANQNIEAALNPLAVSFLSRFGTGQ